MSDTEGRISQSEPWRDKEVMMELREEQGLTFREIGERLGCSDGTACTWMKMHKADELREELDVDIPDEKPYQDGELMEQLYENEELSTTEIAAVLDCSTGAVVEWLSKHGIKTRSISEGNKLASEGGIIPTFYTRAAKGYEVANSSYATVYIHRLQAVAYWGMEAVNNKHVHHKNSIPWDNRKDNLELLEGGDHISRVHEGNIWLDRLRAAEMYDEGASSYDLAPVFDVTPNTAIRWVREVDDSLIRNNGGKAK